MIYIITALKAEAQAFVDKFKNDTKNYSIHISGIGSENMRKKTKEVVKLMQKDDILLNVGICAASSNYPIGSLIDASVKKITCVDKAVSDKDIYEIADMESSGFLDGSKDVQNRYIFKVVSDHFEPKSVTKDMAKNLIFKQIDEILKRIKK